MKCYLLCFSEYRTLFGCCCEGDDLGVAGVGGTCIFTNNKLLLNEPCVCLLLLNATYHGAYDLSDLIVQ